MNKCPKCNNEKLREDYKHCPICGLRLEMNEEQAITQLKDMLRDYRVLGPKKDVQALEYAIKELERTAQEVPVQEQSKGSITTKLGNTSVVMNKYGLRIKIN